MTNEYIDNANPEEAEEQRKKRLDKRNKGRPGGQDDEPEGDRPENSQKPASNEVVDSNLTINFENFILYPEQSLKNVL